MELFKYHVTFQGLKKIVETEDKTLLVDKIKDQFKINISNDQAVIQIYDNDWDDWLDVESLDNLPSRAKLHLILKEPSNFHSANISSATSSNELLSNIASNESFIKYWPLNYVLPEDAWSKQLKNDLNLKRPLSKGLKHEFLESIYCDVSTYTNYPSRSQYGKIAETILQNYPYLGGGMSFTDAMTYWRTILSNKFRNSRKKTVPTNGSRKTVVSSKQRRNSEELINEGSTSGNIKHILPDLIIGDKDVSYDYNEDSMQNHLKNMKLEPPETEQDQYNQAIIQQYDNEWDDWLHVETIDILPKQELILNHSSGYRNSNASVTPRSSHDSSLNKESSEFGVKYWPLSYNLPEETWSKHLKDELKLQQPLTKGLKHEFLESIYHDVSTYSSYPSRNEYAKIAETILQKYPHLGGDMSFSVAMSYWRTSLSDKFRNSRKRNSSGFSEITSKHLKRTGNSKKSINEDGTLNIVRNFLPDLIVGDKEISTDNTEDSVLIEFGSRPT